MNEPTIQIQRAPHAHERTDTGRCIFCGRVLHPAEGWQHGEAVGIPRMIQACYTCYMDAAIHYAQGDGTYDKHTG